MSNLQNVWSSASQIVPALIPFYREGTVRLAQESGAPDRWFLLNYIRSREPDALTPEAIGQRYPYAALERQLELYDGLVEAGFAKRDAEDHYRLTGRGRELIEGFFNVAQEGISTAEPLPAGETAELVDLLGRLVQAAEASTITPLKPALLGSRWTDPGAGAESIALVDQYVTDLQRYREDAHFTAWQSYRVAGCEWEAFSLVWQDEAGSAAEIVEQRPDRGYAEEDYAAALQQLAGRGWLSQDDGRYQVTAEGARIREEAEAETERIFFESWSVLNDEELSRLGELATRAVENLTSAGQPEYWNQASAVSGAIFQATREVVNPLFEAEFDKTASFLLASMALGSAPQPFTVEDYGRRYPYANPKRIVGLLKDTASAGYLQSEATNGSNGQEAFTVTETGQKALDRINAPFYVCLDELEVLSPDDLETIAGLLKRLVEASLVAEEPAGRWAIANSHNGHPDGDFGPLARIDQHLDDLNAFRDDSHIAAWRPTGLDGRTWESFSFVWDGKANTADALAEQLPNRGYDAADYAASLSELTARGLIEKGSDGYQVTVAGESLRQEAEATTNHLFFAPWSTLEDAERMRLLNLLIRLRLSLQDLVKVET
jgi:ribosomal protein S19E (S16A)